jgi:DNA polymerase III sliding clamp (beta) subunit (PCNA family)
MKAVVNSESLQLLHKLCKNGFYEVVVKNGLVKLLAESPDDYQVEILEPYNGKKEEGRMCIPENAFALFPSKTSLIIENNVIKSLDQEISIESDSKEITEIEINTEKCVNIPNFNELIECKFAVTKDTVRPVLQCICIDKNNMVALDGYRMSVRSNKENITDEQILISGCIVKLLRYFSKSDMAAIYQDDDYIRICFGWVSITCKKPKDLQFINYESLFPKEHATEVTVNASDLATICKKVIQFSQSSRLMRFNFDSTDSYILAKESGITYKKNFKCDVQGKGLLIAVNPQYMLDALKNYKDNVNLYMNTDINPIILTDNENKKDMVLPIRLLSESKKVEE